MNNDEKLTKLAHLIGALEFQADRARSRKQTERAGVYERHAHQLHTIVRPEGGNQ